ncbi:hypothetical protein, conserved [Babesia ovata]|uniref:Uncharacterized protein n=1 Tax=Babesia ovata TaxID=189622 RepID=A0A2H6KAI0_9APIC|nr:uncharacterized protein BOVATA_014910 [Babesia ovata]GBE59998.1 hypothetical protein, conserved [Babesia ovata]
MSFLHGVLQTVKEDDNVTTYDKDGDKITSVITFLNTSVGQGRQAFQAAVSQVDKATGEVKDNVSSITALIEDDRTQLQKEKVLDLSQQITNWTKRADWYIAKATDAQRALNDIDSALSGKLKCHVSSVVQAVKTFRDAARNRDLKDMHQLAGAKWNELLQEVDEIVNWGRNKLQEYLKDAIGELHEKIMKLQYEQFFDLKKSVNEELHKAFQTVEREIQSLVERYGRDVVTEFEQVKQQSEEFQRKFPLTKNALQSAILRVSTDIAKLQTLTTLESIDATLKEKTQLLQAMAGQTAFSELSEYFILLDSLVMDNVKKAMEGIAGAFKKFVYDHPGKSGFDDKKKEIEQANEALNALLQIDAESFKTFTLGGQYIEEPFTALENLKKESEIEDIMSAAEKLELSQEIDASRLMTAFKAVLPKLSAFSKAVAEHSQKVVDKAIDEIQEKVQAEIGEVAKAINGKVEECRTLVATNSNDFSFTKIGDIEKNLSTLGNLVNTFQNQINQKIINLQGKIGKSDDTTGTDPATVYTDLKKLHANVGLLSTEVQKVIANVEKVQAELTNCIAHANKFVNEASEETKKRFEKVRVAVNSRIEKAFKALQQKAHNLYTSRKRKELIKLKALVEQEKTNIENIINDDKIRGVKGLLKEIYGGEFPISSDPPRDSSQKSTLLTQLNVAVNSQEIDLGKKFKALSTKFRAYMGGNMIYNREEIDRLFNSHDTNKNIYSPKLGTILEKLKELFDHIEKDKTYTFDHTFSELRDELEKHLAELHPSSFSGITMPVLQSVKSGLTDFLKQLGMAYVSRYSGEEIEWDDDENPEKQKCAKVFLTLLSTLQSSLTRSRMECKSLIEYRINDSTDLGKLFARNGFRVSELGKQNGELQNTDKMKGEYVYKRFTLPLNDEQAIAHLKICEYKKHKTSGIFHLFDFLNCIHSHVERYNEVCHHQIHDSPRAPSSIFQMLCWLNGLWHNPVREPLYKYMKELFPKPNGKGDMRDYKEIPPKELKLQAYPKTITYEKLEPMIKTVCSESNSVLKCILGNGHAGGIYAVDFSNNSFNLYYPTSNTALICMLREILNRLYHQLYFLCDQCSYNANRAGWRDCFYGRDVGGSDSQCNTMRCANQACDQTFNQAANQSTDQHADQMATQKANQTCNQHPKCGLKSPLQSYLEDGLQGFLPHSITVKGTNMACSSCSMLRGMPCKTPMGFTEIGIIASHISKGQRIFDVIGDFCGDELSPLSKLCAVLNCLLPGAPKTLDDLFSFYYNFISKWYVHGNGVREMHREDAFGSAVQSANFKNPDTTLDVSPLFESSEHSPKYSSQNNTHLTGDLYSLVECKSNPSSSTTLPCGPYLRPLCQEVTDAFSNKNAGSYLSWIVYLTETFYDLLKKLYDDCSKTCGGEKPRCRIAKCPSNCNVGDQSATSNHDESCNSILQCRSTSSILCRYGFTLLDRKQLSAGDSKRTCRDLCEVLKRVVGADCAFVKVLQNIDEFLKQIRWPFITTLLALWSLSLLYLLHIAVVRLDVLRIRSHLRSPASHRIAAQSLLAAARVKALANVKYFSP